MRLTIPLLFILFAVSPSFSQEFSANSVDLGIVVSNIEKSAEFYTQALGFKEVGAFSVPGEFCREIGLTDGKKLDIRVFALGEGPNSSKIKLMQIDETQSEKSKNEFIHSSLGFSYLTISVTDTTVAEARLKKAGIKTVKQTPKPLPPPLPSTVFLTIVRDPDGNFVELVGPRK